MKPNPTALLLLLAACSDDSSFEGPCKPPMGAWTFRYEQLASSECELGDYERIVVLSENTMTSLSECTGEVYWEDDGCTLVYDNYACFSDETGERATLNGVLRFTSEERLEGKTNTRFSGPPSPCTEVQSVVATKL